MALMPIAIMIPHPQIENVNIGRQIAVLSNIKSVFPGL
jgi:hypothetical protein